MNEALPNKELSQEERTHIWGEFKKRLSLYLKEFDPLIIDEIQKELVEDLVSELYEEKFGVEEVSKFERGRRRYEIKEELRKFAFFHCFIGSGPSGDSVENPSAYPMPWDREDQRIAKKLVYQFIEIIESARRESLK